MIIRTAASQAEIELALEVYAANEPSMTALDKTATLTHWLVMFANCPEGFWIAEDEASRQVVGVASALRLPPQWILTNFYVLPAYQGKSIGRKLLTQAFATRQGCDRSLVHASSHASAQSLYMKLGMYPLPYSITFRGNPPQNATPPTLTVENYPIDEILSTLNAFDQKALGFTRPMYHRFWAAHGTYFLIKKANQSVAYFRISPDGIVGPLIVTGEQWMATALDWAIYQQKEISTHEHEIFVPGANRTAIACLFDRGYHIHDLHFLLSSDPMPGLSQVIFHDTDLL